MDAVRVGHPADVAQAGTGEAPEALVDVEVVDHQVGDAVGRHARADRQQHRQPVDRGAGGHGGDGGGGEQRREQVVRLDPAASSSVVAAVPGPAPTVHHPAVDHGDRRLHRQRRDDRHDQGGHVRDPVGRGSATARRARIRSRRPRL
jgi:hypothetical protein